MLVGYARVSTDQQETDLQLDALRRAGVSRVYEEKGSSVGRRPQLQRALGALREGDVLVVFKLDRLARSLRNLLDIIERMEAAGAGFRSLTEPIDTSSAAGRLMLQMLGAVAEFERSLIRERSIAGQQAAIARGAKVGRPRVLGAEDEEALVELYQTGCYTQTVLADAFGCHLASVRRALYRAGALRWR
ncbi:recombinase family protein [Pseudorhodoferax sp.]|uniref:recombinase family protein n=1 Tax=Pseudorhodoferax sp. TaxID=1993553 RepID=UPI0039E53810